MERVRTSDGRVLECDFVVVGVGVQPRTGLAAQAGLAVDNGIVVDEHLRTSAPGVFAAGDVANAHHPFYGERVRVEHWANALHQGPVAARAMLGQAAVYDRVPYFFSDQYDVGMEYAGFARTWDRVVFRGDPASREFIAFWLTGDRVVAGMNVNVWDVIDHDPAAHPRPRRRSMTGASPIPTSRSRTSPSARQGVLDEPPPAIARRRRLDLARHALARAAGQRRLREPDRRLRGHRRDLEPHDLRQGDHRLGPLRRPAPRAVASGVHDPQELFFELALDDVGRAADLLRPVYEASGGRDGFVSFECTPDLADDTAATIEQAVELWGRLARPNVMIKVPATEAGIPAIEELTARGVNVNVTLLFSVARYEQVIDAYIAGLERRAARGQAVDAIASVASFFVSRVDAKADACSRPTPRCAAAWRSPTPIVPTGAIATASPTSAGSRCARPAPARSDRCGPAPEPRIPPTPTCSTSRS